VSGKKNLIQNIFPLLITMCYIIDEFLACCGEKQYNTFLDFLPEELIDLIYSFVHKARMRECRFSMCFPPHFSNSPSSPLILNTTQATLHMNYHEIRKLNQLNVRGKESLDKEVSAGKVSGFQALRWKGSRTLPHNLAKRHALFASWLDHDNDGTLHHHTTPLVSSYKGGEFDGDVYDSCDWGLTPGKRHHHWQLGQLQCGEPPRRWMYPGHRVLLD